MNTDYLNQQTLLMFGRRRVSVWLVVFLLWWVSGQWAVPERQES